MILLAADTSGLKGSLALAEIDSGKILKIWNAEWLKKAIHSEVATLELQSLFHSAGMKYDDVTHLAVNYGPGSFTGLRVGVSLIRTFAYVQKLNVALVNRLEILAAKNSGPGDRIFVATKAVQDFFYGAGYERLTSGIKELIEPRSLDRKSIESLTKDYTKVLFEGDENGLVAETSAQDLVQLLVMEDNLRPFSDWFQVKPLYIRASEAEEKLRKGLLKPL